MIPDHPIKDMKAKADLGLSGKDLKISSFSSLQIYSLRIFKWNYLKSILRTTQDLNILTLFYKVSSFFSL